MITPIRIVSRLLIPSIVGFPLFVFSQVSSPIPLIGNLQALKGVKTPGLYIRVQLQNCSGGTPQVSGYQDIVPSTYQFIANPGGEIIGAVWPNNLIRCSDLAQNSMYAVTIYDQSDAPIGSSLCYRVTSEQGAWNLNAQDPISCRIAEGKSQEVLTRNLKRLDGKEPSLLGSRSLQNKESFASKAAHSSIADFATSSTHAARADSWSGVVDVKNFGARGDGVADDTSAFNKAIAETTGVASSCLYVPAGTYLLDEITLKGPTICLKGDGIDRTILKSLHGKTLISGSSSDSIISSLKLSEFTAQGIGAGVGSGIYFKGSNIFNVVIDRVKSRNWVGQGIAIPEAFSVTITNSEAESIGNNAFDVGGSTNTEIRSSYAVNCGKGYSGYRVHSGRVTIISSNGLNTNQDGESWGVFGDNAAEDGKLGYVEASVIGSNIESFTKYGIRIKSGSQMNLSNTRFLHNSPLATNPVVALLFDWSGLPSTIDASTAIERTNGTTSVGWMNGYPINVVAGAAPPFLLSSDNKRQGANIQNYYSQSLNKAYGMPKLSAVVTRPGTYGIKIEELNSSAIQTGMLEGSLGGSIPSAAIISPTSSIQHVTGSATINIIRIPILCESSSYGCQITLIPDGEWSTTTHGNIAAATVAVVGKALILTYDPGTSKWYPSY